MENFNDLFNRYFGNNNSDNKKNESVNENRLDRIINLIDKLNSSDGFDGMSPDEAKLGEPTTTRTFVRDGVTFEESTWDTEFGTIVRITTKEEVEFSKDYFKENNIPLGKVMNIKKEQELSLDEQLKIAVKDENYEKAAKLRDLITKKNNKDITSENLDNKGLPEKDEWNF